MEDRRETITDIGMLLCVVGAFALLVAGWLYINAQRPEREPPPVVETTYETDGEEKSITFRMLDADGQSSDIAKAEYWFLDEDFDHVTEKHPVTDIRGDTATITTVAPSNAVYLEVFWVGGDGRGMSGRAQFR